MFSGTLVHCLEAAYGQSCLSCTADRSPVAPTTPSTYGQKPELLQHSQAHPDAIQHQGHMHGVLQAHCRL